jgi:hypothetical protein
VHIRTRQNGADGYATASSIEVQLVAFPTDLIVDRAESTRIPPPPTVDRSHPSYSSKLLAAINTALNASLFDAAPEQLQKLAVLLNPEVAVRPVERGCVLFSHSRCSHALFYAQENADDPWQTSIASMRTLNARFYDLRPIWVVVPNKTTVYFHPEKNLWNEIKRNGMGPNLLEMTNQALRRSTIDLFPANNTHLSTEGYLLLGQEVMGELRH